MSNDIPQLNISNDYTTTVTIKTISGDLILPCFVCTHPVLKGYEFALHKSVTPDNDWVVAERSLGMYITKDDDMDAAVAMASVRLSKVTPERFKEIMENGKKQMDAMLAERNK